MLFYFTGTGNSLYIAKQIETSPVSIPQVIHKENQVYFADSIGIVAPVYGHEVPQLVKDFLKKATFHTDYFYMILTYGNRHGGAAELAQKLCEECGLPVKMSQLKSRVEITPEVLRQVADTCNIIQCNPRTLDRDEVYDILMECL